MSCLLEGELRLYVYMENRREWRGGVGEEEGELQRTRHKGNERNKKVTGNETGTRAVVLV